MNIQLYEAVIIEIWNILMKNLFLLNETYYTRKYILLL